jgi:hypothetical protein
MVTIAVEPYSDGLVEEMLDLIKQHYDEITLNKDVVKLDPDWDRYAELAANDRLLALSVRNDQNKLIGYSWFFIGHHIHYKSLKMASNDVLFLTPEARKGRTGIRLIKDSETACRARGVDKIIWHIKFAKDFRNILYRLGYADEDALVGKILRKQ